MHLPLILLAAGWSNALVIHDQETLQQVRIGSKKNLNVFDALFDFKIRKDIKKMISSHIQIDSEKYISSMSPAQFEGASRRFEPGPVLHIELCRGKI